MSDTKLHPQSLCVHAGISKTESNALVPPVCLTSAFRFKSTAHGAALFAGKEEGYIYTRVGNPTVNAMEQAVAVLESGYKSLGCSSGMAAINTVFSTFLAAGDHMISSKVIYGSTCTLLESVYHKFGVKVSYVDTSDLDQVANAMTPETKLIYVETPGNPTLCISDIQGIAKTAHSNKALLVVDNTFLSPYFQKPLTLGADIVVHSLTKYINGHADVIAGIIIDKDELTHQALRTTLTQTGGVIDPFNAFLVHRGIKTLSIRMEQHAVNGLEVARFLENHPQVAWVRYPGLKTHPQYSLGQRQQTGAGSVISFELKGGFKAGEILLNNVKLCNLAVSLGGVETLIQHPASMTHSQMSRELREKADITDGLVRIAVGIEHADDIIYDLTQALEKIK